MPVCKARQQSSNASSSVECLEKVLRFMAKCAKYWRQRRRCISSDTNSDALKNAPHLLNGVQPKPAVSLLGFFARLMYDHVDAWSYIFSCCTRLRIPVSADKNQSGNLRQGLQESIQCPDNFLAFRQGILG